MDSPENRGLSAQEFEYMRQEITSEGESLWNRFYSFATLQGGLLVLATSTSVTHRKAFCVVGILLGLAGSYVQWISLHYQGRNKKAFHDARLARGLVYTTHPVFNPQPNGVSKRRWWPPAASKVTLWVALGMTGVWVLLVFWLKPEA